MSAGIESADGGKTARLYRMVMDKHVCPYGTKSKWLLEREGFVVEDNWLTTREQTDAFKAEHGVATTPQPSSAADGSAVTANSAHISAVATPRRTKPATLR